MCYSQTGDCYNGNFIMGKRHGHGICIYQKTGNVYNGLWYNDKPAHAECILFPLYHPSVYDMDASDILDFNEIVNEEQKEEDYSSSSISSSKLISSIQLILSILDKGMIEEQEIEEEEQHQEYDLLDICVSSTSFQKNYIGWPQQPPTEEVLKFNMIFHDYTPNFFFQNIKIKLNSNAWMTLKSSVVIFQALKPLQPL